MNRLSPEREGKITASFLPALMAGLDEEIFNKWLELIGDPTWQPIDLSRNWPAQLGIFLEPFALNWHERETGHELIRRGEFVQHPTRPNIGCTLDGYRKHDDCVIDCKVSAWRTIDDILAFYTPQMVVQRACVQCANAALVIVHGGGTPHEYALEFDAEYERVVWERVDQFQYCVDNFIQPIVFPRITPPEKWRSIDLLNTDVNWADEMKRLLETWEVMEPMAKIFEETREEIKDVLPEDVGRVSWGQTQIRRARNRAVTIKRVEP